MGDKVECYGVGSVGDGIEAGETACERFFIVGEVVEYWEGAYVRGERIGFGEPAFVKKVEGNGVYAIKMVGSSRGKFRKVGWRSLFKDGSSLFLCVVSCCSLSTFFFYSGSIPST